jgi:integrase
MASQQRTPGELKLPRGVTIRTHSSGKQGIQIAFTYRGTQCRETLHGRDVNTPNLKYAAGLLARINSEIADGDFDYGRHFPRSPAAHRTAEPGSMVTVSELMKQYLAWAQDQDPPVYQPSSLAAVESMVKTWIDPPTGDRARKRRIGPPLGERRVVDLGTEHLFSWIATDLRRRSLKYVRNVVSPLRQALHFAIRQGYISSNPASAERLKIKPAVPKENWSGGNKADPLTRDEVAALLDAVAHEPVRYLFQFAFATGLRTGELYALRWSDVDTRSRIVHVRRAIVESYEKGTKTKKGQRDVELTDEAIDAVEGMRSLRMSKTHVFINPSTRKPFKSSGESYFFWGEAVHRAQIPYRSQKQTRHTYASWKISEGCNLYWLADQLGHEGLWMIFHHYGKYIHQNPTTAATVTKIRQSQDTPLGRRAG